MENETHTFLWDFEIQTDHLIPARRPDQVIIYKRKQKIGHLVDFIFPRDHSVKMIKRKKKKKKKEKREPVKKSTLLSLRITEKKKTKRKGSTKMLKEG